MKVFRITWILLLLVMGCFCFITASQAFDTYPPPVPDLATLQAADNWSSTGIWANSSVDTVSTEYASVGYSVYLMYDASISNGGKSFPVIAVDGLYVYPNAGASHPGPVMVFDHAEEWGNTAYNTTNNGFAYYTANPYAFGVRPRETLDIGSATYRINELPTNQVLVMHVLYDAGPAGLPAATGISGEGRIVKEQYLILNGVIPAVPEPGTLGLLGTGLFPMLALFRRRKRM